MDDVERLLRFRTRWRRWLGQKTRCDSPAWTTLLDCNWSAWARHILEEHGLDGRPPKLDSPALRQEIKAYYSQAINFAGMDDLHHLDCLYCQSKSMK